MKMMKLVVAGAALLGSTAASAGLTGNAGVFSSYMFRGVDQTTSGFSLDLDADGIDDVSGVLGSPVAVQGGIDYAGDSGIYAGTWVSSLAGSYETDLYAGWTGGGFDVGAIWYGYRDAPAANFLEVYAGYSAAGFSGKIYFSPEFGATEDSAIYATASYAIALSDTLSLTPQVGFSTGDGVEATFGDDYADYSLTLGKTLDNGFNFTFGYVGNSEDEIEKGQLVVGLKKSFSL